MGKYDFKHEPQIHHDNIENVTLSICFRLESIGWDQLMSPWGALKTLINKDTSKFRHMKNNIMIYSCAF